MRTVYDFDEPADCVEAAKHIAPLLQTEAWNILRQLAERHFDVKIALVEKGTSDELARLRGRAEGVQALFNDVRSVLQRAGRQLEQEPAPRRHAVPLKKDDDAGPQAPQRRATPVVAMPGRGQVG